MEFSLLVIQRVGPLAGVRSPPYLVTNIFPPPALPATA